MMLLLREKLPLLIVELGWLPSMLRDGAPKR